MMKSNKIFLETMEIDMSVEDYTNELLALQMELWPSCQVLPGAEVRLCLLWTFLSRQCIFAGSASLLNVPICF